jgi:hypothetical protein
MPAPTVPFTGNGATISGLGVTAFVTSIEEIKISVATLDVSTLTTTGYKNLVPSDLREAPEVKVNFLFLGTGTAALVGDKMVPTDPGDYAGTVVTITYPGGAGTFAGKAFIKEANLPKCANGEIMAGSYVLQFDGKDISVTNAA